MLRVFKEAEIFRCKRGLVAAARELAPAIPTKSGLMLGLGETEAEVLQTMGDLRSVDCQRLTLGQYLRPSLVPALFTRLYRQGNLWSYLPRSHPLF